MTDKNNDLPPQEGQNFINFENENSDNQEKPFKTTPDNFLTNEGIIAFEEARQYMIERGKRMRKENT